LGKLTYLVLNPSVLTCMVIQLLGFPTLCKVTHHTSQPRFACATFQDSPSAYSRQHCYQCRPCLLVVFPLVRRQGFFQPIGAVSMPGTQSEALPIGLAVLNFYLMAVIGGLSSTGASNCVTTLTVGLISASTAAKS